MRPEFGSSTSRKKWKFFTFQQEGRQGRILTPPLARTRRGTAFQGFWWILQGGTDRFCPGNLQGSFSPGWGCFCGWNPQKVEFPFFSWLPTFGNSPLRLLTSHPKDPLELLQESESERRFFPHCGKHPAQKFK